MRSRHCVGVSGGNIRLWVWEAAEALNVACLTMMYRGWFRVVGGVAAQKTGLGEICIIRT